MSMIKVVSNVFGGYDVYATSLNSGLLGGPTGLTSTTIDYSIYIDAGGAVLASDTIFDGATSIMNLGTSTLVAGVVYALSISVAEPTSGAFLPAGEFTDTLTFVLTTK